MIKPIQEAVTINTVLLSHTVTRPLFQGESVSCVSKCNSVRRHITGYKTPWATSLATAEELQGTLWEMADESPLSSAAPCQKSQHKVQHLQGAGVQSSIKQKQIQLLILLYLLSEAKQRGTVGLICENKTEAAKGTEVANKAQLV